RFLDAGRHSVWRGRHAGVQKPAQQATKCIAVLGLPLHNFTIIEVTTCQTVKECCVPNYGHSLLGPPCQPCRKLCDTRRHHIVRFYRNATNILGATVPPAFVEIAEIEHWKFDRECIWVTPNVATMLEALPMQRRHDD